MERRQAFALFVVLMMPFFAGCNVKDWYNQNGTVRIELEVLPASESRIGEFSSLRVAIYGVSLRQTDAEPKHFGFEPDPVIVDLVQVAKDDERVPLTEFKTNLRATDRVAVRLVTLEAITAAGESLQVCRIGDSVDRFPCFYQPNNTALLFEDRPFSPPRGGEVVVGFPVGVAFAQQGRATQYYLEADPSKIVIETKR